MQHLRIPGEHRLVAAGLVTPEEVDPQVVVTGGAPGCLLVRHHLPVETVHQPPGHPPHSPPHQEAAHQGLDVEDGGGLPPVSLNNGRVSS